MTRASSALVLVIPVRDRAEAIFSVVPRSFRRSRLTRRRWASPSPAVPVAHAVPGRLRRRGTLVPVPAQKSATSASNTNCAPSRASCSIAAADRYRHQTAHRSGHEAARRFTRAGRRQRWCRPGSGEQPNSSAFSSAWRRDGALAASTSMAWVRYRFEAGCEIPRPRAKHADVRPVPEPRQREHRLPDAGQRPGSAPGADLAAAGQQPGHEQHQLEWDVKG